MTGVTFGMKPSSLNRLIKKVQKQKDMFKGFVNITRMRVHRTPLKIIYFVR